MSEGWDAKGAPEDGRRGVTPTNVRTGFFGAEKFQILAAVGGSVLVIDLASKWIVQQTFFVGRSIEVFGTFLRLTYILNPGAAFGIHAGEHSRLVFTTLALVILVFLLGIYRVTPARDRFRLVAIALVCGGALGNLLDRLNPPYGVVDFLDVGFGTVRWPVFNVADIGIAVGAVLLAISFWMEDTAEPAESDDSEHPGGARQDSAGAGPDAPAGVSAPYPSESPTGEGEDGAEPAAGRSGPEFRGAGDGSDD